MGKNQVKLCFFDDYWIDFRQNAVRRWFQPKLTGLYEDAFHTTICENYVRYIPELKKYRLWYSFLPNYLNDHQRYTALAESDDGMLFKPVDLYPDREDGMKNVLFAGSGTFLYDEMESDPKKKYKFAGLTNSFDFKSTSKIPLYIEFSENGIDFTKDNSRIAHPYTSDTINSLYYNPNDELYYINIRGAFCDRRISVRTSKDLVTWSQPIMELHPGAENNDGMIQTQYYGMCTSFQEGIFYGLLWHYMTDMTTLDFTKMVGTMDAELTYSYDGKNFLHTNHRLAERPEAPNYGCWQLTPHCITDTADKQEYIISMNGSRMIHATTQMNKQMAEKLGMKTHAALFYRIRKDGFCAVEGISEKSQIITKSLELLSNDITCNINASTGTAAMGLFEPDGTPILGFTYEDCIPFIGNDTKTRFKFREHDILEMVGKQIRIGIQLNRASIYAIEMEARPYITRPQVSFANPMQMQ